MNKQLFGVVIVTGIALVASPAFAGGPFSGFNAGIGIGHDNTAFQEEYSGLSYATYNGSGMTGEAFVGWGGRHGALAFGGDLYFGKSAADSKIIGGALKLSTGTSYGANVRVGWFPLANTVLYGKGTLVRTKFKYSNPVSTMSTRKTGWGLGLGTETTVARNLSVRLEYTHIWYSKWDVNILDPIKPTRDVVTASLVYNF